MNRDTYAEYLKGDHWLGMRLVALQYAGHRCQVCNSPDELDVHHRTYERLGNEAPGDLTVLCRRCHSLFHESAAPRDTVCTVLDGINAAYVRIDQRKCAGIELSGIPSSFVELDQITAGWQDGELTVIGSRPSVGKTSFALNLIGQTVVSAHLAVLFACPGSVRTDVAERLLCMYGGVDNHRLRRGHLNAEDIEKLFQAGDLLGQMKLYIDDAPAQDARHVAATARRLKQEHGLRLLIVDDLHALADADRHASRAEPSRAEPARQALRRLKLLARELSIPVIVLAHIDRGSEDRQDHRPRLSDLRESPAIEREADTVLFLHRPDYHEAGLQESVVEVIVAKQRNGPTGELTLMFNKWRGLFENWTAADQAKRNPF